jgi:AsmA protein
MKALAIVGAVTGATILLIILAAPFLIPTCIIRTEVAAFIKEKTNRNLRIAGGIRLSLLPELALTVDDVSLSSPQGEFGSDLVNAHRAYIALRLLPLLHGSLEIDQLWLVQPAFHLEVDKQGRRNWVFRLPRRSQQIAAPAGPRTGTMFTVAEVTMIHGSADYFDHRDGARQAVTDLNLSLALPGPSEPGTAKATASWNGRDITLALTAASPAPLWQGGTSDVTLRLRSSPLAADFAGKISAARHPEARGGIRIDIPSMRLFGKWVGARLATPGTGFGRLLLTGAINAAGSRLDLTDAEISFDASVARGAVTLDTRGRRPALAGHLEFTTLDLNPYVKPRRAPPAMPWAAISRGRPDAGTLSTPVGASSSGWSQAPIDLSPLRRLDADLELSTQALLFRDIKLGKSTMAVHLKDGKFALQASDMTLYRGYGRGEIDADAGGAAPTLAISLDLRAVDAGPLLHDVVGVDQLAGSGEISIDLEGGGKDPRAIVASLTGDCRINLANGKYMNSDLIRSLNNIPNRAADDGSGQQNISYQTLSATGVIHSGVLHNGDLKLASSKLSAMGSGIIDLNSRSLDYVLAPNVSGMGSASILVTGPWADPVYKVKSVTITRPFLGLQKGSGSRARAKGRSSRSTR